MTRTDGNAHLGIRATREEIAWYRRIVRAGRYRTLSEMVRRLVEREARRLGVKHEEVR